MKASIIIPTRGRSQLLLPRLKAIEENTPELETGEAEAILVMDVDDEQTLNIPWSPPWARLTVPKLTTPANKWNAGANSSRGEWLVTISDDCIPQPNWLKNAFDTKNYGFLGLPDGVTGDRNKSFTPLYMATRKWLKRWNGGVLVLPCYGIWYADIETCMRAHDSLTYKVAWNSVVQQLHHEFKTAPDDEIYQIGRSRRAEDEKTFNERKQEDFPNNFPSVL